MEIIRKRGPENIQEDDDYQAELEEERGQIEIEEQNQKREDKRQTRLNKISKLLKDIGWI